MFTKFKPIFTAAIAATLLVTPLSAHNHGGGHSETKSEKKAGYEKATKNIVEIASEAGTFNTLLAAAKAADLAGVLSGPGPFTVFAPTDEAFAKLPAGTVEQLFLPENKDQLAAILTYHVVPGKMKAKSVVSSAGAETVNGQFVNFTTDGGAKIDGANITATDIKASNGVIHVIDSVILPENSNIVEVANSAGSFGTLLAAAQAAGLADTLANGGPFTVFAPTDEAFAKLPEGTVQSLLQPENKEKLAGILKHHVVSGKVYSTDLKDTKKADSLNGTLKFWKEGNGYTVNSSNIVAANIDAGNGVIHVIDSVMIPGEKEEKSKGGYGY